MNFLGIKLELKDLGRVLSDVLKGCGTDYLLRISNQKNLEKTRQVQIARLDICANCKLGQVNNVNCFYSPEFTIPHAVTGVPTHGCSCLLSCKTALLDQECPAGYWGKVSED